MQSHTQVPFVDLEALHAPIRSNILREIERVVDAGAFALGVAVEQFEREFADYCGGAHCVGLNSGTSAVHIALLCAGVGPGDEVITTPYSWIATSWAVSYTGARPVFVDISPESYCLDAESIELAITPRTRAILPVHLFGYPADMEAINEIARRHDLVVIEDSAQAHGARYRGQRCGSLGDIAAFSFYPAKNLGAFGEAGAIVTDNPQWARRARALRDHAQITRHHHEEIGYNYRMEGIQGAVLKTKLAYLDEWNDMRRTIAALYRKHLAGIPDLKLPEPAQYAEPVYHIFAVQHPQRDELRSLLSAQGVQSSVHYPCPIHLQPAYDDLGYDPGTMPNAETLSCTQLSLPMHPHMTETDVKSVALALGHSSEQLSSQPAS